MSVLRRWRAFGSGVGIEIAGAPGVESLRIALVKVSSGSVRVLDQMVVADFEHHAAGVWGTEYSGLLRKHGMGHVAATVLLPRRDVIVRQLALPGVEEKDLAAAVGFQLDGLHPYREEDATASWARLSDGTTVLVAITKRSLLDHYRTLFAEAGIRISGFTCSAAALYSARRLTGTAEPAEILAVSAGDSQIEVYGESASRPVFSAVFSTVFDGDAERAVAQAAGELRLSEQTPVRRIGEIANLADTTDDAPALASVAALNSACPSLSLPLNLLPEEFRQTSSRAAGVPAAILAAAGVLLLGALYYLPSYQKEKSLESLNAEISKVTPAANRAVELDKQISTARQNTLLLDEIRGRSKADMDVLGELTKILPPPTWLNLLELSRTQVSFSGEAAQAAPLLGTVDASPLFEGSEFSSAPVRVKDGEAFRIRTNRQLSAGPAVLSKLDTKGIPAQ